MSQQSPAHRRLRAAILNHQTDLRININYIETIVGCIAKSSDNEVTKHLSDASLAPVERLLACSGKKPVITSMAGFELSEPAVTEVAAFEGGLRPQPPGVRNAIPADFRYRPAVSRRTPVACSIRRRDQPRRPSAITCSPLLFAQDITHVNRG